MTDPLISTEAGLEQLNTNLARLCVSAEGAVRELARIRASLDELAKPAKGRPPKRPGGPLAAPLRH